MTSFLVLDHKKTENKHFGYYSKYFLAPWLKTTNLSGHSQEQTLARQVSHPKATTNDTTYLSSFQPFLTTKGNPQLGNNLVSKGILDTWNHFLDLQNYMEGLNSNDLLSPEKYCKLRTLVLTTNMHTCRRTKEIKNILIYHPFLDRIPMEKQRIVYKYQMCQPGLWSHINSSYFVLPFSLTHY